MRDLSEKGRVAVDCAAARQGIDHDAALTLLDSLSKGGGLEARFNHPGLGGMGQWSQGTMAMIGDIANNDLKHRLDALCLEFTEMLGDDTNFSESQLSRSHEPESQSQQMPSAFFNKGPLPG